MRVPMPRGGRVTRKPFDVSVASTALGGGIVEVDIMNDEPHHFQRPDPDDAGWTYCFPLNLVEAKELRDMLNGAIEDVEAGGHG